MSKDFVFIASGGRTGTTFFGERLDEVIADCHSEHEPDVLARNWEKAKKRTKRFGLWHMIFGRLLGISGLRVLGHRYITGNIPAEECTRRLREQRAKYHADIAEPLVVESSWRYWMLWPLLEKAYPGNRLICITRDPRDWVESWRRHQPSRHTKGFTGWFPQGPLTPAQIGDEEWADRWDDLGPFGRIAWDWRIIHRELKSAAEAVENSRLFRFEDLFGVDPKYTRELIEYAAFDGKYEIVHLEGFRASVRNASQGPRRDWQQWPDEDVRLLDAMCGDLMQHFGYGQEPEWLELVARVRSQA